MHLHEAFQPGQLQQAGELLRSMSAPEAIILGNLLVAVGRAQTPVTQTPTERLRLITLRNADGRHPIG